MWRACLHGVGAGAGRFGDDVAGVVDHVRIVAQAADQRVCARAAVERVVAEGAARYDVVCGVARAAECDRAREGQVLDVEAERIGREGCLHRVGTGVDRFRHDFACSIDDVGVTADTADQRVLARAAVEDVVAAAADQPVIAGIAEERVVGRRRR